MRRFLKDYSLGIILALLFLSSLVTQFIYQMLLNHESFVEFMVSVMENWQSEFLQLLSFVVLTKWFIFRGSHESKDSQEKMETDIEHIKRRVNDLEDY